MGAGTPQGSPLSPLIYIMYVNDFPSSIQETCSLSQFADDSSLWTEAYTKAYATQKLQTALNALEGWCRRWRVKLNGEKSNLLFFNRNKNSDDDNYTLHLFDDIVRPTSSAKFLGVEVDTKLTFKKHFESIKNRATKRVNVLKFLARTGVEPKVLMKLYNCYVLSLFEYGCPAFISATKDQLNIFQKSQNDAIRACLKLPSYIRTSLIHEYAGIKTVKERLHDTASKLVIKMKNNNEHIKSLIETHENINNNRHVSPLDVLLNT